MRKVELAIGWMMFGAALSALHAEDVRGQLSITRILTKQRVALPAYEVRGVAPRAQQKDNGAVNEWARVAVYLEGEKAPEATRITLQRSIRLASGSNRR